MKINLEVEVVPFPVPKGVYLRLKNRSEVGNNVFISLSELSDEDLHSVCEDFIASVYSKARKGKDIPSTLFRGVQGRLEGIDNKEDTTLHPDAIQIENYWSKRNGTERAVPTPPPARNIKGE